MVYEQISPLLRHRTFKIQNLLKKWQTCLFILEGPFSKSLLNCTRSVFSIPSSRESSMISIEMLEIMKRSLDSRMFGRIWAQRCTSICFPHPTSQKFCIVRSFVSPQWWLQRKCLKKTHVNVASLHSTHHGLMKREWRSKTGHSNLNLWHTHGLEVMRLLLSGGDSLERATARLLPGRLPGASCQKRQRGV